MKTMKVRCPHCGTIRTVSDDWMNKQGKCPSCQQVFTLMPYAPELQMEPEQRIVLPPTKNPLPGTTIAMVWQYVGGVIWLIFVVFALIALDKANKSNIPITSTMVMAIIYVAIGSLWAFTIAAVIKAINANTRMVEKLYWRQASQGVS